MRRQITYINQNELVPNDIIRADIESRTFDYNIDILKSSIEAQGVMTPLLVSKNGSSYIVVDGNRRYLAGVKAGLSEFPCVILDEFKSDNLARLTEVGFSANELRQDLTPSEEIEALKRVCEKGELTLEEIAASTGKTYSQLEKISRRARLSEQITKMMDAREISKSAANVMTSLDQKEQEDVAETFKALEIPITQMAVELYRGHSPREHKVSKQVVKKLQENIGLHAQELDNLKQRYHRLQKELAAAHKLAQRIWKIKELHDYLKDKRPQVYKDFGRILKILGF